MAPVEIGLAQAGDATRIRELLVGGFRPEIRHLLIYEDPRAAEYFRMQIAAMGKNAESIFVAANEEGAVTGAAEMRRQPDGLLLSYIGVASESSGRGLGSALLRAAIQKSETLHGNIQLDVFAENSLALQWYGRLGFRTIRHINLYEATPPRAAQGVAYLSGLPQADLCQERFGFSSFEIKTGGGTFRAGRIGRHWFRLTDPRAVESGAVFAALQQLDRGRTVLAVIESAPGKPRLPRSLAQSYRMQAEIAAVWAALNHDRKERIQSA